MFKIKQLQWEIKSSGKLIAHGIEGRYIVQEMNSIWYSYFQSIHLNEDYSSGHFASKEGAIKFCEDHYNGFLTRYLDKVTIDIDFIRECHLDGVDVHSATAARLFCTTIDKITPEQRKIGKRLNYHYLYSSPYPENVNNTEDNFLLPFKDGELRFEKTISNKMDIAYDAPRGDLIRTSFFVEITSEYISKLKTFLNHNYPDL